MVVPASSGKLYNSPFIVPYLFTVVFYSSLVIFMIPPPVAPSQMPKKGLPMMTLSSKDKHVDCTQAEAPVEMVEQPY